MIDGETFPGHLHEAFYNLAARKFGWRLAEFSSPKRDIRLFFAWFSFGRALNEIPSKVDDFGADVAIEVFRIKSFDSNRSGAVCLRIDENLDSRLSRKVDISQQATVKTVALVVSDKGNIFDAETDGTLDFGISTKTAHKRDHSYDTYERQTAYRLLSRCRRETGVDRLGRATRGSLWQCRLVHLKQRLHDHAVELLKA